MSSLKKPTIKQLDEAIKWVSDATKDFESDPGGVFALNILMEVKREQLDQTPEVSPSAPVVSDVVPLVHPEMPLVHPEMPLDSFFVRSPVGPPMGPPPISPEDPFAPLRETLSSGMAMLQALQQRSQQHRQRTPGWVLDTTDEAVTRFLDNVNGTPAPAHAVAALVNDLLLALFTDVSIQAQDIAFSPTYCGLIVKWEGGPEFHLDFRAFE